ncbi:MAG: hypothetical protein WCP17_03785 [bacterium]
MDEVKNDYIEKALNELLPTLGTKEFVDHEKLITLIGSKKVKEAIKGIALYLGLPIEVNISYVPKGYRPSSTDGFSSTHLVKTDRHNRGVGGITAQVSIPSNLPFYGTPSMVNFPINVRLSENCAENPATLISVMSHELSHIVLYSMWHKEKENEFYTDLTAMLLGFAKIMKTGRKVIKTNTFTDSGIFSSTTTTHTETTTYGYLSDDNFNFAFNKIEGVLNKQKSAKKKLVKKLRQFKKQLGKTKKLSFYFEKYLEYLDKNLHQKISPEDGQKISAYHQPGHTDNFHSVIRKNEMSLENFLKFVENLKTYTAGNIETMQKYETQLKSANEELARQDFLLKKDVDVLKKYVGFFHKLKLRFT